MDKDISSPIIEEINYDNDSLTELEKKINSTDKSKLLFRYPTIYIVNEKTNSKKNQKSFDNYSVYVGETNDIKRRTNEHLQIDSKESKFWKDIEQSNSAEMFLIGHSHFNKSLTLDIENRLMHYMSGIDSVKSISNKRSNQQDEYYTSNELDSIFQKIWTGLRNKKEHLFPPLNVIKDSAIFKASPFHKLTIEQFKAKDQILAKIEEALNRNKSGQLILVTGEAGAGKTVLLSNLFYELFQLSAKDSDNVILRNKTETLLVNHEQQLKVYQQIAEKLGLSKGKNKSIVNKPTNFITHHSVDKKVDILLVDEAHLLWTQGKQSYQGKNQLADLLQRAKVVVAVFDPNQILTTEEYWDENQLTKLKLDAHAKNNLIELKNQMRINGNADTVSWIRNLIDKQSISNIPFDDQYDLKILSSPEKLYQAIKTKSENQDSGISRLLATFDWKYINGKKDENGDLWQVKINDFSMPWNLQLPKVKKTKNLAWAEQEQTIDEIGSTFTIQGFDLNYAGVIIGPSVKYQNGKIVFDKTASKNRKATQRRSFQGQKIDNSNEFLKNELNVLLTRGVNGLYIFAVDDALQQKLLEAQKGSI
ncbi:DUF2075 domain-containing protein [Companilactobacillus halodurans]|uniref:DUF2075 domain-containing protein n=1 Tax=Companilactobacillus halodurans TaxID=2584183 RepID=A0A5P0ZR31_9LACO|nr:DUF2075 domain-containing protein [Companilactobacillus halodurans]MQS76559.1 DUF2075 domain-containing protein [Companilactobacillus halodurans]MQS96941.1 DUF2075 domain-containing protein [Companilactobacillus halodurans]